MKPKRAQPVKQTWQLSKSDRARFWFGLAWVKAQAIHAFGVNGVVLLFAVAGLATLIVAIASFSKKEAS